MRFLPPIKEKRGRTVAASDVELGVTDSARNVFPFSSDTCEWWELGIERRSLGDWCRGRRM